MTYLVLARKWRPRSFDTLVGQDHVVRALTHALDTQRLHHAWLFTGTRGVGKTTLSRILAKSLNCEKGVSAQPCGQCRACVEIDAGRYVDYVELDAASNRGVDEMTQLLEQAVYAPSSARFKVYMIDEVHMLTGHAFNAMLKTLEEPPPHVKFILATTDPQKIPVTVLSRCLQFNLKHMTVEAIVDHLQGVLREEGLEFEAPALRLLAQAAGGSMRDALSLTDQAIAYSAGHLTLDAVQGMLGTIDQRHLVRLLQALGAGRAADVVAVADELAARGLSYSGALADLAVLLSHVAIQQRVPGALPAGDPMADDVAALAESLHPDLVQLYYSVAVHSRSELALAPDEYAGFVMACLRMLSLTPAGAHSPEPPPSRRIADASAGANDAVLPRASRAPVAESAIPQAPDAPSGAPAVRAATRVSGAPSEAEQAHSAAVSMAAPPEFDDVPAWEDLPDATAEAGAPEAVTPEAETPPAAMPPTGTPPTGTPPDGAAEIVTSAAGASEAPVEDAAAGVAIEGGGERGLEHPPEPEPHPAPEPRPAPEPHREPEALSAPQPEPVAQQPAEEPESIADDEPVWSDIPPDFDDVPPDFPGASLAGQGDMPDWEPVHDDAEFAAAQLAALPPAADSPVAEAAPTPRLARMTAADWPVLAARLPLTGLAAELARQSEWVGVDGDCITLRVAIRSLAARQGQARLRTVLTEHFGKVVKLNIEFGKTGSGTARAMQAQRRAELQKQAEAAVENDVFVRSLIDEFGARVMPGSIAAIDDEKVA
ncbi:DNA polymerase III subunit gamma/tau [bacterium SGD-2]|nr:DNA polymerase III subunit gamma/tau [bacterium SGD-2]